MGMGKRGSSYNNKIYVIHHTRYICKTEVSFCFILFMLQKWRNSHQRLFFFLVEIKIVTKKNTIQNLYTSVDINVDILARQNKTALLKHEVMTGIDIQSLGSYTFGWSSWQLHIFLADKDSCRKECGTPIRLVDLSLLRLVRASSYWAI